MNSLPVVVFTDGWEYHQERLSEDFQQRTAILRSGQFWCWSLTWDDVTAHIDPNKPVSRPNGLISPLNPQMMQQVYQQYQSPSMRSLEDLDSFEWLMFYLSEPNADYWQRWALLRTVVQANPKLLTDATRQNQWFDKVVSCTSQDAIDLWKSSNKNLVGEITVSSVLMVWSATDRQRHQKFDPTGSFVLLRLDDAPQGDKVMLRSSWVETLRLFNLYQFLPHSYAVTTMGMDREVKPLLPKLFATQPPEQKTAKDEQWQQIQELMVDERLLPAIEQMCQEGWWLPEAGYELVSDRNTVIAMAELAWASHKIAVTLTQDDQDSFTTAGWSAWAIDDFLQSMDTIGNKLKGDA